MGTLQLKFEKIEIKRFLFYRSTLDFEFLAKV